VGWRDTKLRAGGNEPGGDSFESQRWAAEIENLVTEMTRFDPRGGCWDWVREDLVVKWTSLQVEMKRIDTAFERQNAGDIQHAIANTRSLYHACLAAWNNSRNNSG